MKIDRLINSPYVEEDTFLRLFRSALLSGYLKESLTKYQPDINAILLLKLANNEKKIICNTLDETQAFLHVSQDTISIEKELLSYLYNAASFIANSETNYNEYDNLSLSEKLHLVVSMGINDRVLRYLTDKNLMILAENINDSNKVSQKNK